MGVLQKSIQRICIRRMMENNYQKSGVNIEAGYESVRLIKEDVKRTAIPGVMSKLGQFGAMFDLSQYNLKEPVLISGCDGVGTKIKVCEMANDFTKVGQDLVAMSVNDILVQNAKPLFFLDYIACQKNEPMKIKEIVAGISDGCVAGECALIGGETAEMPDVYQENGYDLAGFAVGVAEKSEIIDASDVSVGDVIIGIPSNGLHSNGYSLVRKVFFKDNDFKLDVEIPEFNATLKDELLRPTRIYTKEVKAVTSAVTVKAMAHITGGGYQENIERSLNGYGADIYTRNIVKQPIFKYISDLAKIEMDELYNYFNMGIGYVFIVNPADEAKVLDLVDDAIILGHVTETPGVKLCK